MSIPNFSLLACLEVAEKFVVVGWGGFQVNTVSNLNPSCIKMELGLGFGRNIGHKCLIEDDIMFFQIYLYAQY